MRSLNTIRDFYRFRYVNGIPCRVSPSHPININCHSRLRYPIDQTQIQQLLLSSFTLFPNHSFSNLHLLFFLHLHDVWRHLGGLPIWEQPCTRLPWRGPSRANVCRSSLVFTGDRFDRSTQEVLQRAPPCAARSSTFVYWSIKGINNFEVVRCSSSEIFFYMVHDELPLHMEYPPSLRLNQRISLRASSTFFHVFQKFEK